MSTTISTTSSDGAWDHYPATLNACVDWGLRDERDPGDEAIPGATEGVGATPAQHDDLADRLRAQAAIHLDSRGRRRTGELLLNAADALTAANARVATLEAECVACRHYWDSWESCRQSRVGLAALDAMAREYGSARAATGPIGGVH